MQELKVQKKDTMNQSSEIKTKFENLVRELQKQVEDTKDKLFESESKFEDLEQQKELDQQHWNDTETNLKKEIAKLKDQVAAFTKTNSELKLKYDTDIQQYNQASSQENTMKSERITELE